LLTTLDDEHHHANHDLTQDLNFDDLGDHEKPKRTSKKKIKESHHSHQMHERTHHEKTKSNPKLAKNHSQNSSVHKPNRSSEETVSIKSKCKYSDSSRSFDYSGEKKYKHGKRRSRKEEVYSEQNPRVRVHC